MTDEDAFADRLLADPWDQTARLVYADWLDDHDRPKQARYLRQVRTRKFVKLVSLVGRAALDRAAPLPPRAPPNGYQMSQWRREARVSASRRRVWIERLKAGWWFPGWTKHFGWDAWAEYLGVLYDDVGADAPDSDESLLFLIGLASGRPCPLPYGGTRQLEYARGETAREAKRRLRVELIADRRRRLLGDAQPMPFPPP